MSHILSALAAATRAASAVLVTLLLTASCDSAQRLAIGERDPLVLTPKSELKLDERDVVWTHAPDVPAPISRKDQRRVVVEWSIVETKAELAPGLTYASYWTFEGRVPGPLLRVREGDLIEIRLTNKLENLFFHNIDFHFVTGQGGGATALRVAPGQTATVEVRALAPGFFMYHCATPDIPMHIANGMYGFVLVEPREGLAQVDREFYLVQSEFYTQPGTQPGELVFSPQRGNDENPSYVVFNGSVGSLTGENALKAKTGETVRLFVGNAGPNLISSFHVIGEILDRVYREGDLVSPPARYLQTTLIPAGGSSVVELSLEVPGTYLLVDHAIFRLHKGAMGQLVAEGDPNPEIFEPKETEAPPVVKTDGIPKDKLSEYGFFTDLKSLAPQIGVVPYSINAELWADGAVVARFLVVPEGKQLLFADTTDWALPQGSILLKTLSMPKDLRQPDGEAVRLETQMLVHTPSGWEGYTYLWNADQSDADLVVAGKLLTLSVTDTNGVATTRDYRVPNINECNVCHGQKEPKPLAMTTQQLHRKTTIKGETLEQLSLFQHHGLLANPPSDLQRLSAFEPPFGTGPLDLRARVYLHVNCAHCHSESGHASYSGLWLDYGQTAPSTIGVCKVPTSAGSGAGGLTFDILPGNADQSIMLYRINSVEPGRKMPQIGNLQVDEAGVALIKAWIDAMSPTGCN